jgi:CubicO group peptidase (beta-lactamase class C family)
MMVELRGTVEPGYERVRDAFAANFDEQGDVGAAVTVYRHGRIVVDLWGGERNATTAEPWEADTLVRVASTTKGITAVCANLLAQQGKLDFDEPVARYWPEFAAEGKESIPVRWIMSHQAGLPVVDRVFTKEDVFASDPISEALAAQRPIWEPGTAHGYHGQTYGYLVGEVIRRIAGSTVGTFLADEVAGPLALDTFIGLPEEMLPRMAQIISPAYGASGDKAGKGTPAASAPSGVADVDAEEMAFRLRVFLFTHLKPDYNSPEWLQIEMPSANGVTTARSLAKLYASLIGEVDGVRLFTQETLEAACTCQADGEDRVLRRHNRYGLGFALASGHMPSIGPGSFGHPGAGGSIGLADPETGVAMAYVMNFHKMADDTRAASLVDAVRASL